MRIEWFTRRYDPGDTWSGKHLNLWPKDVLAGMRGIGTRVGLDRVVEDAVVSLTIVKGVDHAGRGVRMERVTRFYVLPDAWTQSRPRENVPLNLGHRACEPVERVLTMRFMREARDYPRAIDCNEARQLLIEAVHS